MIQGQGPSLSGYLYVNGPPVLVRGMFNPPLPSFMAKVTFQYDDPSTLPGPYNISRGSQIGPNTISLILTSSDGSKTLQISGHLASAISGAPVIGQVILTGDD